MERVTIFKQIPGAEIRLGRSGLYRMGDYRPGTTIICKNGTLWVTQTGDVEDHIIKAGDCYTSPRHGMVVIEAIGEAAVTIRRPSPSTSKTTTINSNPADSICQ